MKTRLAIVFGFIGAILAGALLLMLPVASPSHTWGNPADMLFTACSAVCITGLTVLETGEAFSVFGQSVLLVLVQLGCVGIMTAGTFFLVIVGQRLSLQNEFSLSNAYGARGLKGFRSLVVWVVVSMLVIEAIGTTVLWMIFTHGGGEWAQRLADHASWYRAYFYSVMAFCNAGFSINPGSLAVFQSSPAVLFTMGVLTIVGGIGFLVIYNLCTIKFWRRGIQARGKLSLHTKVVLSVTAFFVISAWIFFFALEYTGALAPYDLCEKLGISFFQAVTPRTCGFTVIPMEEAHPAVRFVSEVMMFIGAAPGSAGGGIKVTTFIVFACTLAAIWRGSRDIYVFKRTVPEVAVRESTLIFFFYAGLIVFAMTFLLITESGREGLTFERLLFESVSAVTTTGLSCGDTTRLLSGWGRAIVMLCMLFGRLGAVSVVMLTAGKEAPLKIRYPKEDLVVG